MEKPASQPLGPLTPRRPPLIELRGLLAVETVRLWAGDLPLPVWKGFYGQVLGLEFVASQEGLFTFRHGRRRIVLQTSWHVPAEAAVSEAAPTPPLLEETSDGLYALAPLAENPPAPSALPSPASVSGSPDDAPRGQLGLILTNFDSALAALRARGFSPEVFHQDSGLTRWAFLRDPAGNLVHLLETRPF